MAAWHGNDLTEQCVVGGIDPSPFKNRREFERPNGAGFKCPICKLILRNAVEFECGCRFCDGCINDYVCDQKDEVQCPSCNKVFTNGLIQPHFPSRKTVDNATVFCENKELGCDEEMKYKDLNRHLEEACLFVACRHKEYGCQKVLTRTELGQHMLGCNFTPRACHFCEQMKAACKMKNHQKKCKKKEAMCPNKCKRGKLHPSKMDDHLKNVCPLSPVACEYKQYGCDFQIIRRDMARHMESAKDNHQLLLTFNDRLKGLEMVFHEETKTMKRKMNELEDRLSEYEHDASRRRYRPGQDEN